MVGPYRTLAVLGEGGMGRVLLASDPTGGLVAVKLVRDTFAAYDDTFRQRLRREAVAAQRIHSPRTARVINADADAGVPWLAYEFHHGPTLHHALTTTTALPETTVLHLAAGLATALHDIHTARFIHRDLSTANVLLTDNGPVVIDFGIARPTNPTTGPTTGTPDRTQLITVTRTGTVIGNPAYMSPEQAMGLPDLTPASDIFSLGTLLATAATGHNPFQGTTSEQTRYNVMMATADLTQIPSALRHIIEPCLTRDPDQRPDAQTLLTTIGTPPPPPPPWPETIHTLTRQQHTQLRRYTQTEPTTLPEPHHLDPTKIFTTEATNSAEPGPGPGPEPGARPSRSWRAWSAVLALTAVAVSGALWIATTPNGRDDTGGTGGAGATSRPDPSGDPAASGHAFVDVSRGDCFRNTGTMQDMEFESAECDGGDVFEVLRAFGNTTDRSVCNYVDHVEWRYSVRDPDVTVCLVYRHGDGAAYNADRGDCVDSGPGGTAWTVEQCRPSGLVVINRIEGRSSSADCERVPHNKRDHYFTVEGAPELNVRLCMGVIGPGTA
ncbi:serine/threonine-protein kinase [Streptomyces sp. NPDC015350]|uniref:serine/threonine-protein kinase n=1 Tax=Streptomyces sp. NPDC015350 TaxID=3364955 RepID=UPI0036F8A447